MKTKNLISGVLFAAALLAAGSAGAESDQRQASLSSLRVDNLPQEILSKLRTDEDLADRPMKIKVSSQNGRVVLEGVVNEEAERNLVTRKVARMEGVKKVDNRLKVKTSNADLE